MVGLAAKGCADGKRVVRMQDLIIKVPESPHRGLLDRERVVGGIREHLKPWCDLVEDIANYGSNLIPRCFVSSGRGLKEIVLLATLLRQVVAMLDGVHILLSQGACYVAQLPTRALFESSVYIDWILLADSDRKCLYYYVHNLRRKRIGARLIQGDSAESKEFTRVMEKAGVPLRGERVQQSKEQLNKIENALSQPKLAVVNAEFEKLAGKRHREPAWYVPLGPRSLRAIAKAVDRLGEHMTLYSTASQVMHGSSYEQHISIGKGEITFQPIRSLEGFETVLRFSIAAALATYRKVLQEYRPGELENFSQKYREKWQRDFMSIPKITVSTNSVHI